GPSISAAGRFVAFGSLASNLVGGDTNGAVDVFVRGPSALTPRTPQDPGSPRTAHPSPHVIRLDEGSTQSSSLLDPRHRSLRLGNVRAERGDGRYDTRTWTQGDSNP